jgi:hypothetical protein
MDLDFLVKFIGGSQLYGLDTPASDTDYRGIYASKDAKVVLGLASDECRAQTKEEGDDYSYFEFRRFLQLCRKTNTNSIEVLFVPKEDCEIFTPLFGWAQKNKDRLIDSEQLLRSTRGYVQSETRLALGERTGKLGGKRKAQLERFGFSPKNVCQIIRISEATIHFLKTGHYPLKLEHSEKERNLAFAIKTDPESFSLDNVKRIIAEKEALLAEARDEIHWSFSDDLALALLIECYSPLINTAKWQPNS